MIRAWEQEKVKCRRLTNADEKVAKRLSRYSRKLHGSRVIKLETDARVGDKIQLSAWAKTIISPFRKARKEISRALSAAACALVYNSFTRLSLTNASVNGILERV
jgi:hypothetical protein